MDSLQDILGDKKFVAPDEIGLVKDYVKQHYGSNCRLKAEKEALILYAPSSGLAATLQLEQQKIIEACNLQKRLVIRIGR